MTSPRYAISYTAPPYSPLAKLGASILGYDCFEAVDVPPLALPGIDPAVLSLLTLEPRRHGLHANFVPPFRLSGAKETELLKSLEALASQFYPILLGRLAVAQLDAFIVLRAEQQRVQIQEFATACRVAFDPFMDARPATDSNQHEIDFADQPAASNTADEFLFHMKLAGPLPSGTAADLTRHFARAFEKLAHDELEVGSVSLMRQDDRAARFRVIACTRLTGR